MLNVGSPPSFPLPRFLSNFGCSLHCTSHPSGSRSIAENVFPMKPEVIHSPGATLLRNRVSAGAVDNFSPLRPLPPSGGPENLRFQAVSKWFFYRSPGSKPTPRWLTAWAAKMKITLKVGVERVPNQTFWLSANPFPGSPFNPIS